MTDMTPLQSSREIMGTTFPPQKTKQNMLWDPTPGGFGWTELMDNLAG